MLSGLLLWYPSTWNHWLDRIWIFILRKRARFSTVVYANRYDLLQIRYNPGQINTCLCITSRMSTFFIYIERHYLSLKFHTVYLRTVIAHKRGCRQFAVLNTGLGSTIIPQAYWVICDHQPTRICGTTSVPSEKFKVSIWIRNCWSDDAKINEWGIFEVIPRRRKKVCLWKPVHVVCAKSIKLERGDFNAILVQNHSSLKLQTQFISHCFSKKGAIFHDSTNIVQSLSLWLLTWWLYTRQ